MKNKILILGVAISGLAMSQTKLDSICKGGTTKGLRCKIKVNPDSTNYCHYHDKVGLYQPGDTIWITIATTCGSKTSKNTPCKNKTKDVSGKCHHHRD
tara:strand:+ start:5098 stop:5391 length:294 start_codon:yes stop_codon:yes gene_type:complete